MFDFYLKKYNSYLIIIGVTLLCNGIFFSIAYYFGLDRVWFNIDYLLLGLFFYKNNKFNNFLLFLFFLMFLCCDVILLVLKIFPFIKLSDILYLSNFIFNGPAIYTIALFGFIISSVVFFYLLDKTIFCKIFRSFYNFIFSLSAVVFLFFVSIFIDNGFISSQSYFLVKNRNFSLNDMVDGKLLVDLQTDYASKSLFEEVDNSTLKSNKILFIVSESWSETAKSEQQEAILKTIYEQKDRFEFIEQGSFFAIGATVAGEIRELCQKKLLTMNVQEIPAEDFNDCVPKKIKKYNYTTTAIHGADPALYERHYWYPLAGFDYRYFIDDLPEGGQCKFAHGRCDVLLVDRVKEILLASDKSFVYWLTLNSHIPYDDKILIDGFDCQAVGLVDQTWSCNNYKLHYQFFVALGEIIKDPRLKGLEVYVVGDHPAPVVNLREGLYAFKGSDVAWLHFKIKDENIAITP